MKIDVRSPAEYAHAHIPGAINIPLLDNEERHLVGLCYKEKGPQLAFDLGLKLAGPHFSSMVERARAYPQLEVYCWRGGLRSRCMSFLFSAAGIPTTTLAGGYKTYRTHVLKTLSQPYRLRLLTGFTGSGKTEILRQKPQFLDLEALANHCGSSFGFLGPQPSNEHFENLIASKLLEMNSQEEIWVENESRMIGICKLPDPLFEQMKRAPREIISCPLEKRIERLVANYGKRESCFLREATLRLQKKLGGVRTKQALELLDINDLHSYCSLMLDYYDRAYEKSQKRYNESNECALQK